MVLVIAEKVNSFTEFSTLKNEVKFRVKTNGFLVEVRKLKPNNIAKKPALKTIKFNMSSFKLFNFN